MDSGILDFFKYFFNLQHSRVTSEKFGQIFDPTNIESARVEKDGFM